jgi:hypothetical protein
MNKSKTIQRLTKQAIEQINEGQRFLMDIRSLCNHENLISIDSALSGNVIAINKVCEDCGQPMG